MEEQQENKKKKKKAPRIMFEFIREPRVIKTMAEMKSIGLTDTEISEELYQKYKVRPSPTLVKRVIQTYSVKGKEFLEKDKEISNIYRSLLLEIVNECKDNIRIMREVKAIFETKIKLYNVEVSIETEGAIAMKLMRYTREIQNSIRTQNDTIKTAKQVLEVLDTHKKEIKVTQIQGVRVAGESLRELEKSGYITINPEYKDSDIFKSLTDDIEKLNKEEQNERKNKDESG